MDCKLEINVKINTIDFFITPIDSKDKDNNDNVNSDMATKVLVDNLRKQLRIKRDTYNDLLYRVTINKVADGIFKLDKQSMIDTDVLPAVNIHRYFNEMYN